MVAIAIKLWKFNQGRFDVITPKGEVPFARWLDSLRDILKIESRLKRISLGNLGDYRSVGEGVCELRIDYGPGYRLYFGQIGSTVVLLLCGGDKSTQQQDIRKAIEYWRDYNDTSQNAN